MSNKNTEIERKFLINLFQMAKFEDIVGNSSLVDVKSIVQMYLLPEFGMNLKFDHLKNEWVITNTNCDISLSLPVVNTELDDLKETLSRYSEFNCNLLNIPGAAARLRFSESKDGSNQVFFTLKIKDGNKEFEDEVIDDNLFISAHRVMSSYDEYTVTKTRDVYKYQGVTYEIDLFDHDDLIILEVEFISTEKADSFVAWFDFIAEVTGKIEFSNLYIARNKNK